MEKSHIHSVSPFTELTKCLVRRIVYHNRCYKVAKEKEVTTAENMHFVA